MKKIVKSSVIKSKNALEESTNNELSLEKLTDSELLKLCQKYGTQAILWRRKFIGLLPEVDRRKLYEKKNCQSVYEFAAKFGGVSPKHVGRVLNLSKRFKANPILKKMLVEGNVSSNKLAKVASIVGFEKENEIAHVVKNLSCRAVETYVRDVKNQNGLFEPLNRPDFVHVNKITRSENGENGVGMDNQSDKNICKDAERMNVKNDCDTYHDSYKTELKKLKLNLSEDVLDEVVELQEKGIDVNDLFKAFLEDRKKKLAEKKKKVAEEIIKKEAKREGKVMKGAANVGLEIRGDQMKKKNRYIPVKVKTILREEHGTKCAIPGCKKPSEHIHHTARFALTGSSNPYFLAPLCKEHHEIAHTIDKKTMVKRKI
ncbi:hypothetical protein HOG48_00035 [Candidatus Peregrinibacteria bacterium]|jgi:hypothetical protein|nr:hypothetical protein [Candidatus Peregrinibacteria bacterium]